MICLAPRAHSTTVPLRPGRDEFDPTLYLRTVLPRAEGVRRTQFGTPATAPLCLFRAQSTPIRVSRVPAATVFSLLAADSLRVVSGRPFRRRSECLVCCQAGG